MDHELGIFVLVKRLKERKITVKIDLKADIDIDC